MMAAKQLLLTCTASDVALLLLLLLLLLWCLQDILARVRDASLRHCLQFGVGLHHAGLAEADRQVVERLFVSQKIQVCMAAELSKLGLWPLKMARASGHPKQ
jgi:hypothetical protein